MRREQAVCARQAIELMPEFIGGPVVGQASVLLIGDDALPNEASDAIAEGGVFGRDGKVDHGFLVIN
jgi:hypothetical protein